MSVTFTITRPKPPVNTTYFPSVYSNSQGVNHDQGPRLATNSSTLVFRCPTCVPTVPHYEITCVVPPGFGGQLEWTVNVFNRVSAPFRYVLPLQSTIVTDHSGTFACACRPLTWSHP